MITGIVIGVLLLGLAVLLFVWQGRTMAAARRLRLQEATPLGDLAQICQAVREAAGPGQFSEQVEVKGTIEVDQPLVSELTRTPCVYYSFCIVREYETTETTRDSEGKEETRTVRKSDTVTENRRMMPFRLRDASGAVLVEPERASLYTKETINQSLPEGSTPPGAEAFTGVVAPVQNLPPGMRILGYRYTEEVLPLGVPAYVIGEATDAGGELAIRKPARRGDFLISLKSEEEVLKGYASRATWLAIGAGVCAVLGMMAIGGGILSGR